LFKTLHFLLVQHKQNINKTGQFIITILAKIVHKIKEKIIKFCLDNTDYMSALNIPQTASSNESVQTRGLISLDIEMVRTKIEELEDNAENAHPPNNLPPSKHVGFIRENPSMQESTQRQQHATRSTGTALVELNIANPIQTKIEEESKNASTSPKPSGHGGGNKSVTVKMEAVSRTATPVTDKHQMNVKSENKSPALPHAGSGIVKPVPHSGVASKKTDTPSGSAPADTNVHLMFKKKFCQKLAPLLQGIYNMDKDRSQNITLVIENRIRTFFPETNKDFLEEYKQAIKSVYRLIKSKTLRESELESFCHIDLNQFRSLYMSRLVKATRTQPNIQSSEPENPNRSEESRLFDIGNTPIDVNKQTPTFEDKMLSPYPTKGGRDSSSVTLNLEKLLAEEGIDNEDEDEEQEEN
jgi:hypothetical protein